MKRLSRNDIKFSVTRGSPPPMAALEERSSVVYVLISVTAAYSAGKTSLAAAMFQNLTPHAMLPLVASMREF